jgi:hypothetical protein
MLNLMHNIFIYRDTHIMYTITSIKESKWHQPMLATLQQHLDIEYISLSWYDIPDIVVTISISLIEGCC